MRKGESEKKIRVRKKKRKTELKKEMSGKLRRGEETNYDLGKIKGTLVR